MVKIIGAILAGGQSRRFGTPKAFAQLNGKNFWEYSYEALSFLEERIIISRSDYVSNFNGVPDDDIILDDHRVIGKGPLAGIYTVMKSRKAEWYIILSCDIPLVNEKVIRSMLNYIEPDIQAVIPDINGKLHPLIGLYHHSIFNILKDQLAASEYKMVTLLNQISVLYVSEKHLVVRPEMFSNINSKTDYYQLLDQVNKKK